MRHISRSVAVLGATALLIIGGGAYAFASAGGGTITVCVKKGAGTLYKAKHCAKGDAKLSWNARGPRGLTGAQGSQGVQGAQGVQGVQGVQGPAGPFPTTLPAGKTIVGTYDISGVAAAAGSSGTGSLATGAISYSYSAPSQTVIYVDTGTTNSTCTGTYLNPTAPNGYTCIYETGATNAEAGRGINSSNNSGVDLYVFAQAAGYYEMYGTFAATGA